MSLGPVFRSPLTDLTGCLINAQNYDKCSEFELKLMDCYEAYGLDRGKIKCADLLADFKECFTRRKQLERLWIMRMERHKQYYLGNAQEHYAEAPKVDSY